jgi:hypothetical protein
MPTTPSSAASAPMTDDERRLLELLTRDRKLIMDYYESVVVNYIRADRALFVNTN